MPHVLKGLAAALMVMLVTVSAVRAGDLGSPEEAQAMVERAIAHYDKVGREQALKDFSDNKGAFIDRDLYVLVTGLDCVFVAHGVNRGLIGKNLSELKDVNGKFIVKSMVEIAQSPAGSGWVDYVWTNPTTKKLEPKRTWIKLHDGLAFGVGVYDQTKAN